LYVIARIAPESSVVELLEELVELPLAEMEHAVLAEMFVPLVGTLPNPAPRIGDQGETDDAGDEAR